jgi:transcriptional regulator with XRE-family HTH domain
MAINTFKTKRQKNELIDIEKIRLLCEQKQISLAELGRRIGLDKRQKISARLNNENAILGDELFLIADELNVSADDLRAV